MAVFNPSPNPTNDPNWLGLSKPISDVPANKTAGMALSLAGNALELGVGMADEIKKKGLKDDIYNTRDIDHAVQLDRLELNKNIVTADATPTSISGTSINQADPSLVATSPSNKGEGAPDVLNRGLNQFSRLASASKTSPVVNDTLYSMQAEALAKKLRAENPGYREYIDETISKAYGMPIANAAYKNVMQDLNHALTQINSQNKELVGLYDKNKHIEGNAPRVAELIANPSAENMFKYQNWVNKNEAAEHKIKTAAAIVGLAAAKGNLKKEEVNSLSIDAARGVSDQAYASSYLNSPEYKTYTDLASRGEADPTQAPVVLQRLMSDKAKTEASLRRYYSEKRPELGGASYESILGQSAVNANIALVNDKYDLPITILTGDKTGGQAAGGLLKMHQQINDQTLTGVIRNLYEKYPQSVAYQAAIQILSPQVASVGVMKNVLSNDVPSAMKGFFDQATTLKFLPPQFTATDPNTNQPKPVKNPLPSAAAEVSAYKKEEIPPTSPVYQGVFQRIELLNDPKLPADAKNNLIRSLFSPENYGVLENFRPDQVSGNNPSIIEKGKHTAFSILTSKDAARNIEQATKGNSETRAMYLDWVKKTFADSIVRSDIAQINTVDAKKFYFKWNDGSDGVSRMGFQLIDKASNRPVAPEWAYRQNPDPTQPAMPYVNVSGATLAATSLERLNRTLPNITGVLQTFGDKRPVSSVMLNVLQSTGASFGGQSEESIVNGMSQAITSSQTKPNDTVKSRFSNPGNVPETGAMQYTSEPRPMSLGQWMANPANLTPANDLNRPGPIIAPAQQASQPTPQKAVPEEIANNPAFSHYDPSTGRYYMRNTLSQDSINKGLDAKNRAKRVSVPQAGSDMEGYSSDADELARWEASQDYSKYSTFNKKANIEDRRDEGMAPVPYDPELTGYNAEDNPESNSPASRSRLAKEAGIDDILLDLTPKQKKDLEDKIMADLKDKGYDIKEMNLRLDRLKPRDNNLEMDIPKPKNKAKRNQ